MPHIVHALPRTDWHTFGKQAEYRPESLAEQGFVHCSKLGQVVVVADYNHIGDDDLVLPLLEESRIEAPVRYEPNEDGGGSAFPHVHGPLKLEHIIEALPFEQDGTGVRLPEKLLHDTLRTPRNRDR